MRIYPLVLTVLLASAVCACSKSDHAATPAAPDAQQQDSALFKSQRQALDKAKGVEQTLQSDEQHLKEQLEKQEAPSQ
jgi:septal ring factor EnvC (AmiA/AmiB activator)